MPTVAIPRGTKGFDVNTVLTAGLASVYFKQNYRFALRYVRRKERSSSDLSAREVQILLNAGLAVMPVQHVKSESSWFTNGDLGTEYGIQAGTASQECYITPGTSVWCDLEGVDISVSHGDVIAYCNNWCDAVTQAGYLPGLYVGWHSLLTPVELYYRLKFKLYWGAYNLNVDQYPVIRGICMKQHTVSNSDIDSDLVIGDLKGSYPMAFAPAEWAV